MNKVIAILSLVVLMSVGFGCTKNPVSPEPITEEINPLDSLIVTVVRPGRCASDLGYRLYIALDNISSVDIDGTLHFSFYVQNLPRGDYNDNHGNIANWYVDFNVPKETCTWYDGSASGFRADIYFGRTELRGT